MEEFNLQPQEQTQEQQQDNSRLFALKSILGGNRLLVIWILLLVTTVFAILSGFDLKQPVPQTGSGDYFEEFEFIENSGLNRVVNSDVAKEAGYTAGRILDVVFTGIPRLLAVLGFILVWMTVRNNDDTPVSATGLSLLRAMNKIGLIGYWILLFLVAIMCLIFLIVAMTGGIIGIAVGFVLLIFVGGIAGGICVLMILRNNGLQKAIDKVSFIANGTGDSSDIEIGPIVNIALYISMACAGILCVSDAYSLDYISLIAHGSFCAYYFLLARLVGDIRDTI
jgi:hypothetical protein